jgi:hypothetical protein
MPESRAERTARLLAEGLELFGEDQVERAIACWRAVLALDPTHREARDYLESAGAPVAAPGERARAAQGLALAGQGELEQGLALLRSAAAAAPRDHETQAALDLVRARLYAEMRQRIPGGARPRLRLAQAELLRLDLPPEAGFLLSMLDGRTRVEELMAVAGLDALDVLHLLSRLEQAGAVEVAR